MQNLTGWVVESTQAEIRFESQDLNATKEHLQKAMNKYQLHDESVDVSSKPYGKTGITGKKLMSQILKR